MKKILYIAVTSAVLLSCESQETNIDTTQQVEDLIENEVNVVANQVASVEVKGMECVMACGGSIKKALKKTNGVSDIDFDFEMGREFNIATISYDQDVINLDRINAIILELNDGQFSIGESNSEELNQTTSTHEEEVQKSSTDISVEVSSSAFEMPNLLDLLSGLLPL